MAKNALMARAPPLTPLGELTELPKLPSCTKGAKEGKEKKSSDEGKAERREWLGGKEIEEG